MIIGVDGCGKRQRESGKGRVVCVHVDVGESDGESERCNALEILNL